MDSVSPGAAEGPTTHTEAKSLLKECDTLTLREVIIGCSSSTRHIKRVAKQLAAADDEPIIKCTFIVDSVTDEHPGVPTPE